MRENFKKGTLFFLIFIICLGCQKQKTPIAEKMKTRERAHATIREIEELENEMAQIQELEEIEKELEKFQQLDQEMPQE